MAILLIGVLGYALAGRNPGATLDTAVQRGERPVAPGQDISLAVLGGSQRQTLAALRGQVVFVNIWGSWCDPCKDEAPLITAVHDALQQTGEGQVLGVTHIDPSAKSLAFVKEFGLTFPSVRDVDNKLYDALGAGGTPETIVIDQHGKVAAIARSGITPKFVRAALKAVGSKATIPASFKESDFT